MVCSTYIYVLTKERNATIMFFPEKKELIFHAFYEMPKPVFWEKSNITKKIFNNVVFRNFYPSIHLNIFQVAGTTAQQLDIKYIPDATRTISTGTCGNCSVGLPLAKRGLTSYANR